MKLRKITPEYIKTFLLEHNPKLTLVEETFKNSKTKCKWIEEGWGEFWRTPDKVINRKFLHHPKSKSQRAEKTCINKYGVKNTYQLPHAKKRAKESSMKKYGVECALSSEKVREGVKTFCLENFGVDTFSKVEETKNKIKNTFLIKYGVDHPSKNPEFKETVKQSYLKKTGYDNPSKNPIVKQKKVNTFKRKTGYNYPMQNPEVKEKSFQTQLINGTLHKSHQEQELLEYCKTLDPGTHSTIVYLKDKQFQIDILLPKFKVAIEYNGMFWHSEGNKLHYKNKHLDKTLACQEKGYRLIHIWETEWLSKPQIVKNYLRSVMGIFDKRVPARKCKVKEVPKEQARDFLNQNHLQGSCSFNTALGLYYENELVGIAVLGTHHRSGELNVAKRFAFAQGVQVIGGISKLSKALLNLVEGNSIITWADRRLGAYEVYANSGWVLEEVLKPDYFYWSEGDRKVVSKQHYLQTKKKYGLSEREAAAKNRHLRIWDCGKYRFRMGGNK